MAMARPQSSLMDYANFGANVYQSRQTGKLARATEAQNTMIEQMQMQQQIELMHKELIISARKVLIEVGDIIEILQAAFEKYPAHTAISVEMIGEMLEPISADLFEELADLERQREISKALENIKLKVSKLPAEQIAIRDKMIHIVTHQDELGADILTAKTNEENLVRLEQLKIEWENGQPEWQQLQLESSVRVKEVKKVGLWYFIASLFILPIIFVISSIYRQNIEDDVIMHVGFTWIALSVYPLARLLGLFTIPIHPLRIIKNEIWLLECALLDLDETNATFESKYEGESISEKMLELQASWNEYLDHYTPDEDEDFSESEESNSDSQRNIATTSVSDRGSEVDAVPNAWGERGPRSPPRNSPPQDLNGQTDDDGYEWLEYPIHSEKWWYRDVAESEWKRWEQ